MILVLDPVGGFPRRGGGGGLRRDRGVELGRSVFGDRLRFLVVGPSSVGVGGGGGGELPMGDVGIGIFVVEGGDVLLVALVVGRTVGCNAFGVRAFRLGLVLMGSFLVSTVEASASGVVMIDEVVSTLDAATSGVVVIGDVTSTVDAATSGVVLSGALVVSVLMVG